MLVVFPQVRHKRQVCATHVILVAPLPHMSPLQHITYLWHNTCHLHHTHITSGTNFFYNYCTLVTSGTHIASTTHVSILAQHPSRVSHTRSNWYTLLASTTHTHVRTLTTYLFCPPNMCHYRHNTCPTYNI